MILLFAQSISLLRTACRKEQHLAILRSSVSMVTAGEQKAIQVSPRRLGQGLGCLYQPPCQAQQAREQSLHCTLYTQSLVDGALAKWCHRSAQAAAWQDWICSLLVPLTRANRPDRDHSMAQYTPNNLLFCQPDRLRLCWLALAAVPINPSIKQ